MDLSLVVINYNDALNTINFINSIIDYEIIKHIVIVDNLSTDNSLVELKKINNKKVKIIANPSNAGYGEGINIAARYLNNNRIDGILLVCNNDIIINSEEDLKLMMENFNEQVGMVGPVIEEHGNKLYGFRICTIWQEIKMSLPFLYKKYENKYRFYQNYQREVDCAMGSMFMIKLDSLRKADYYDSKMFLYYEENVMGIKFKGLGLKTIIDNRVTVIHNHSQMIDKTFKKVKKYKLLKQSHRYYVKNYLHANILQMLVLSVVEWLFLVGIYCKNIVGRK